jgi:hypothetical protein
MDQHEEYVVERDTKSYEVETKSKDSNIIQNTHKSFEDILQKNKLPIFKDVYIGSKLNTSVLLNEQEDLSHINEHNIKVVNVDDKKLTIPSTESTFINKKRHFLDLKKRAKNNLQLQKVNNNKSASFY